MNDLTTHTKPTAGQPSVDRSAIRGAAQSLEEMLLALAKYGQPRLSHDGDGWHCAVEMYVSAAGVNFNVASKFSNPTPMSAAVQCAQRLDKALSDINAG